MENKGLTHNLFKTNKSNAVCLPKKQNKRNSIQKPKGFTRPTNDFSNSPTPTTQNNEKMILDPWLK
jgi:hypothetical protein